MPGLLVRRAQTLNSTHDIRPLKTFYTEGIFHNDTKYYKQNATILSGPGALVTFDFAQNITGRLHIQADFIFKSRNQSIGVSFFTSPLQQKTYRFLPLLNGTTIIEDVRDVFRFVTLSIPTFSSSVPQNSTTTISVRDIWVAYTNNTDGNGVMSGKEVGGGTKVVVLTEVEVVKVKAETIVKAKNSLLAGILKILTDSWGE